MLSRDIENLASRQRSLHAHLGELSPNRRREAVQAVIQARVRYGRRSVVALAPIAFIFSILTLFWWLVTYQMSAISTVGCVAGVVLGVLGLVGVRQYRVDAFARIASGDFSDDDVLAWSVQEHDANQRFLAHWHTYGRYLLPVGAVVLAILYAIPSTEPFATLLLLGGVTTFLSVLVLLPATRHTLIDRLRKRR